MAFQQQRPGEPSRFSGLIFRPQALGPLQFEIGKDGALSVRQEPLSGPEPFDKPPIVSEYDAGSMLGKTGLRDELRDLWV